MGLASILLVSEMAIPALEDLLVFPCSKLARLFLLPLLEVLFPEDVELSRTSVLIVFLLPRRVVIGGDASPSDRDASLFEAVVGGGDASLLIEMLLC